jgi:hypothetical protein
LLRTAKDVPLTAEQREIVRKRNLEMDAQDAKDAEQR